MKKLKKVNLLIFIINIILFILLCVLENLYANSCTYDVRARTTICNYKQLENIINILYWIIMINSIVNVVSSIILLIKKVNNFIYFFIVLIYNLQGMSQIGQNVSKGPVPNFQMLL